MKNNLRKMFRFFKRNKAFAKSLSFVLTFVLLFYVTPSTIYAKVADAIKARDNTNDNAIVTTGSYGTYNKTTENVLDGILYEATELREENVKHFRLSDGRYVAAQYNFPVHVLDENGMWQDIDNHLSDYGSEFSNESARIKFAKKITGNSELFALHDGNTKISLSLIGATKGTVGAVTNNSDADTDTELQKMMNLEKISASVIYKDILKGVDIQYVAFSKNVKENIIVKEKSNTYSYSFELKLNGIIPTLTENGDIELRDEESGTIKYVIPAPIVFDANKNYAPSGVAEYDLEHKNGTKYILTVSVDTSWMNSGKIIFPVTIDPTVADYSSHVTDTYVDSANPDFSGNSSDLLCVSAERHSYWKSSNLPVLPVSAYITEAIFSINATSNEYAGSSEVGVYDVESYWDNTLTWNAYLSGAGAISELPICYRSTYGAGDYDFDVTKIVKRWYNGNQNGSNMQYGLAFASIPGYFSDMQFYSNEANTASVRTALTIVYTDMKGVESYWPYSSHSIYGAGTGNINLANGNLIFDIPTLSTTDSLFGFTPSLIYNSSIFDKKYVESSILDAVYTVPSTGNGFKINICETLVGKKIDYNTFNLLDYFVYTDADGTEHELYPTDQVNVFEDRDGLGLVLTTHLTTPAYATLVDENNITRVFISTTDKLLPSEYCLSKIKDTYENELIFVLDSEHRPTAVQVKPVGVASPIEMLELLYTSDGLICAVYNPTTKHSVVFGYSSEYNSEIVDVGGNYLRTVQYCYGNAYTTATDVLNYATSGSGTNVFVYDTNEYTYDAFGKLTEILNTGTGHSLVYVWDGYRVTKVSEYVNDTLGQEIAISYGVGYTQVRSTGNDELLGTEDDILTYYIFDNQGRVVSTYSCSVDGRELYGASSGVYNDEVRENSLENQVVIGGAPTNYLLNGDFEEYDANRKFLYWTQNSRIAIENSKPYDDEGYISANFNPIPAENATLSQSVFLSAGKYTLSMFYVSRYCENYEGSVSVSSTVNSGLAQTNVLSLNNGISDVQKVAFSTTFEVSPFVDGGDYVKIEFTLSCSAVNTQKIFRIDNIVLSNTVGSADYSLVSYGDFTARVTDSENSVVPLESYWIPEDPTATLTVENSSVTEFENALKLNTSNTYAKQRIYQINESDLYYYGSQDFVGNAYYDYIISGFAYAPVTNPVTYSEFGLKVDVYYYQGAGKEDVVRSFRFDFNSDITAWQFISGSFSTKYTPAADDTNKYNCVSAIDISCEFTDQLLGYALFDNISVIRADTNNYVQYGYYEDGQSEGLLAAKSTVGYVEYYLYDGHKNISAVVTSEGNLTLYTYNSTKVHQLTSVIQGRYTLNSSPGDLYGLLDAISPYYKTRTDYEYDTYGNVVKITVSSLNPGSADVPFDAKQTRSLFTYDVSPTSVMFGALLAETDSTGVTTKYYYNSTTCMVDAVVNTSSGDGLVYRYDYVGRLISVTPAEYISSSMFEEITNKQNVEYTYNEENLLNGISTVSTDYAFSYDEFGNRVWVKVGEDTIANYEYAENNGKLTKIIYGNGFVTEYVYNALEMLVEIWYTYNDGTRIKAYEYEYTADGLLHSIKDNINGKKTVYTYDNQNRVKNVVSSSDDGVYNDVLVNTGYFDNGNLHFVSYYLDLLHNTECDDTYVSYFCTYSSSTNALSQYALMNNEFIGVINFEYDILHRLSIERFHIASFKADYVYNYYNYIACDSVECLHVNCEHSYYTSDRIEEVTTIINDTVLKTESYGYNYNGYITSIEYSDDEYITYFYDDLGQLVKETNSLLGYIYTYTYDNAGNITSVKRKVLEENDDGWIQMGVIGEGAEANALLPNLPILPPLDVTNTYSYTDSEWGDLLTAYNGFEITYDEIGNPLSYYNGSSYTFTWQGRRLVTATKGTKNMSFSYNDEGLRVSKTVNGVTTNYYYQGTLLIAEETNSNIIVYLYDENGTPVGFMYRAVSYAEDVWDIYAFEKNIFGDVVAVYNADTGVKLISYTYNAWGVITTHYHNGGSSTTATKNPYKYRGYYYDSDLAMYYLQTRYYDPAICRFINADSALYENLLGYNLFVYCNNNPVMYVDSTGEFPILALVLGVTAVVGLGLTMAGIASDNNILTAIGLTMVAAPALVSGGMAIAAGLGGATLTGIAGSVTTLAGIGTGLFASAEYQEALTGNNWMLDSGMSEDRYNGSMLTVATIATSGTVFSSFMRAFNIKSVQQFGRFGKHGKEGYYGIKFTTGAGKTRVLSFHTHSHVVGKNISQWHWQLQKWNPKAMETAGTIAQWIWWNLRRK